MPLYIAQSGDLDRCHGCPYGLTHSQTLKDFATQLLIKYKSGALVTQFAHFCFGMHVKESWPLQVQMNMKSQKRSENSLERLFLP